MGNTMKEIFRMILIVGEGVNDWREERRRYQGQFYFDNMEGNAVIEYGDRSLYKGQYVGGIKKGE